MGKRGDEMFQLREAEKSEFLLSLCFVLQAFKRLHDAHPHWRGQST